MHGNTNIKFTDSLDCMPRNKKSANSLLVRANPANGKVKSVTWR